MTQRLWCPRSRRLGKTLNISTLGYSLQKSDEDLSHLFEGLSVTADPKAMAHFQKYPTLLITFKDVKAKTFPEALEGIGARIRRLYEEYSYLLKGEPLPFGQARSFERILAGEATKQDLQDSLFELSQMLYKHHGTRVVILIDEYDTPIQSGYMNGFFDDVVLFFRNVLSAALKDNVALFKGPWSILNYIQKGTLAPYWVNTGSSDLIEHLATRQGMGLSAKSAALLNGESIEVPIDDNIVLRDINRRPDALWNFLLFSGYLKLAKLVLHEGRYTGSLCIPNIGHIPGQTSERVYAPLGVHHVVGRV